MTLNVMRTGMKGFRWSKRRCPNTGILTKRGARFFSAATCRAIDDTSRSSKAMSTPAENILVL